MQLHCYTMLGGVMHRKTIQEISSRCLCLVSRGPEGNKLHRIAWKNIKNPRRQALYYRLQWQQLSPHGQGTKSRMDVTVCRFVAAVREFIPHRHRRKSWRLCTAEWNSIVDFGSTETHCQQFLLSVLELVCPKIERCEGLRLCGLSSSFDGQTHFSIMHTREGN